MTVEGDLAERDVADDASVGFRDQGQIGDELPVLPHRSDQARLAGGAELGEERR